MAVGSRPFAYNPGAPIAGTTQIGNLAVGTPTDGFEATGLQWWNGPGEGSGYIIAKPVPLNNQDTPVPGDDLILDPAYNGGDISLSNNNQTATQLFGYQKSVLGETLISGTDKVMFSILSTALEPFTLPQTRFIGVGKTTMNYQGNPYGGYPGNDNKSIGFNAIGEYYYNGNVVSSGLPTWGHGDTIDVAISHGQYWWIRVNGGYWNNISSANPATLAGGLTMSGQTNYYPALCPGYEATMKILNTPKYGYPTGYNFLGHTTASVGFLRSTDASDASFVTLVNKKFGQSFLSASASVAKTWLNTNGYWTSYGEFSSSITIATNAGGGLIGFSVGAQAIAFDILANPAIGTTYPIGSTIIFQNGETRTLVGYDNYGSYYDVFYDSPISTNILFPIIIGIY